MEFPIWAKNILFLLVLMISGLLLVIIIDGLMSGTELLPFNTAIESTMVHLRTPMLTTTMVVITKLGTPFLFTFLACFIAVMLFLRGDAYNALLFLTSMAIAIAALTILKNIFQIARPASDLLSVEGWSFPSGHATVATAFFFIFAHTFFRQMRTTKRKTILVVGSIHGAGLVSISRLYLGVHWTLDILAGVALGFLSVSFCVLIFNSLPSCWRQGSFKNSV